MYKTILLPIDTSHTERAKEMINAAKSNANNDTKIILLNVIDIAPAWADSYLQAGALADNLKTAKTELASISVKEDFEYAEILVRSGHSYRTILDVATEKEVDLIIMGSHKPGVGAYFLGSTADKVVRHAKCSVFIIR